MEINLRYGFNKYSLRKKNINAASDTAAHNTDLINLVETGEISPSRALQLWIDKEKIPVNNNAKDVSESVQLQSSIDTVLKELDELIGLDTIKVLVKELQAFITIQRHRTKQQLLTQPLVLHMIFKGNPGTGKTTVARVIGKLLNELEVLPKGHMIEVERADLVGEYIGHTAQRTREHVKKALGGILFIDEAYSLARGGEKDFGKEAIDVLVKAMEDHKDDFILILAGYKDEMEWFLLTNPGLRSRLPIHMEFPDYTVEELLSIADLMLELRQYTMSDSAREELKRIITKQCLLGHQHGGNARLVRNVIEKAIRRQAVRLIKKDELSREDLLNIRIDDLLEAVEDGD